MSSLNVEGTGTVWRIQVNPDLPPLYPLPVVINRRHMLNRLVYTAKLVNSSLQIQCITAEVWARISTRWRKNADNNMTAQLEVHVLQW